MRARWRRWLRSVAARTARVRESGPASQSRPRFASPGGEGDEFDWVAAVEQARRDWEHARRYFECVTDQDLVDHAIHLVTAAEKRYTYLLKQARRHGIQGLRQRPLAQRRAVP